MEVTIAFTHLTMPRFPMTVTMPKTATIYDVAQVVHGIDPTIKPQELAIYRGGQSEPCMHLVLSPSLVEVRWQLYYVVAYALIAHAPTAAIIHRISCRPKRS